MRVTRQHLDQRAPKGRLVDVASHIGGVQAQSLRAAYIGLWTRVKGLSSGDIDRALYSERTLARTWAMRQTVHLLPSEEFSFYVSAVRPILQGHRRALIRKGLDAETIEEAVDAARRELASGPLTRRELASRIPPELLKEFLGLPYPWSDLLALLKDPYALGKFCFGPPRGQETTFVRVDRWLHSLPQAPAVEEAEEELLLHYLRAFGPATLSDFAYWSGYNESHARTILDRAGNDTAEVSVEGETQMMLRDDRDTLRRSSLQLPVRLLPGFDAYLLGYKDKSLFLDGARYKEVFRRAAQVAQTVLADGRVVATWTSRRRGNNLMIKVDPFEALSSRVADGVMAEADGLARFLGARKAEVSL